MDRIRIGIVGYGNLGRGLVSALSVNDDMELVKIFTRRNPSSFNDDRFESFSNINDYVGKIDIMILALGSATDVPELAPQIAEKFSFVDSYDNHKMIYDHYKNISRIAAENNNLCMISTGWDPGMFSLNRVLAESVLPQGRTYTFWGKGVSQGHSDAIRRVDHVLHGVQYTVPKEEILANISQETRDLESYETHDRVCFVVSEGSEFNEQIERDIVTMKDYFEPYHTEVNFISEEEFMRDHQGIPHGGHVIRVGDTGDGNKETIDFALTLDSNPEFTASVNVACARALYRLRNEGRTGALTMLEVPPCMYSRHDIEELIKHKL